MPRTVKIRELAAAKNDASAAENRALFQSKRLRVVNMIGSPGSGKTSLLEVLGKTFGRRVGVITGDIQTDLDCRRLADCGIEAVQIETGGACHLTAGMIGKVLPEMDFEDMELLFIENVGNLVCPATYDLGEDVKIGVLSVAEGDEKPRKYPELFVRADATVITKTDLIPYVRFEVSKVRRDLREMNSGMPVFEVSCVTMRGMEVWHSYVFGSGKKVPVGRK